MTTWSVVKDDSGEEQARARVRQHLPQLALLICLALVVVSLGIAFSPGNPPKPPEPSFSERARVSALDDARRLRTDGVELGAAPAGTGRPAAPGAVRTAVTRTVSLLTTQSRALLRPGKTPDATSSASAAASSGTAAPAAAARFAADLAKSGRQRLADAAAADGGMARLLAAVGTAQLLQSSAIAAAAGAPDPAASGPVPASIPAPGAVAPDAAASCPAVTTPPSASPAGSTAAPAGTAELPGALAAVVSTELETVYGYQVALTRLDGAAAKSAAGQLARHEALVSAAESLSRSHCTPVPPREPGYALDPSFLASPRSGLASLETAALPAYGDLVALSDGETRTWAISGLLGAARRAVLWGADPGPVPGVAADPASFPTLPAD